MKPEHRFNEHMDRGRKVVTTPDVTDFMRDDRFELAIVQAVADVLAPEQHRLRNAKHTRFEGHIRTDDGHRPLEALHPFQPPKCVYLSPAFNQAPLANGPR